MNINFSLSMDQANLIVKHLGKGTYVEVFALIAELQKQATPQIAAAEASAPEGQPVP